MTRPFVKDQKNHIVKDSMTKLLRIQWRILNRNATFEDVNRFDDDKLEEKRKDFVCLNCFS